MNLIFKSARDYSDCKYLLKRIIIIFKIYLIKEKRLNENFVYLTGYSQTGDTFKQSIQVKDNLREKTDKLIL